MKKYSTIIGIIVSLIVIFGAGFSAIGYFAKSSELQMLSMKVDYGFLEARANDLQKRMWALEDRYGTDRRTWPKRAIRDWQNFKIEWEAIMKKLEIIFAEQQKKGKG